MRLIFAILLLAAGCTREERPEPPTEEESARLNEAEEMLDNLESSAPATPEREAARR